jgi:hypothetical protein
MKFIGLLIFISLLITNCKPADPLEGYQDLDLMSYGLPIKIKAPENAKVEFDDLGFVKDVSIKGENNFYIQLQGGTATTTNIASIKEEYLTSLKNSKYFSKIIEEEEAGFIYEKDLGDGHLNYDFRYIRVQGDHEYIFQRGLVGQYTIEEVKTMYNAVK